MQEFSRSSDAFETGSTHLYKKTDTAEGQGKIYWGPLWDFDTAWGENMGAEPGHDGPPS